MLLKTEAAGWAGFSHDPVAGQWTIHLSRQVRDFANVRDISDYWSRKHKPRQTQRTAPPPPMSAGSTAAPGVSYNFHAPVTGSSFAVGNNATQHAASGRADAEAASQPSGRGSDTIKAAWITGWFVIAAAVIGAVVAAFLTNGFGLISTSSPRTNSSSTDRAIERRYDGTDPQGKNGRRCADPPPSQPVSQIHPAVIGPGGAVVGHVELRTSPICPVIWARVSWLHRSYAMPAGWSLHIVMYRTIDPATATYISHATSSYVYGNMTAVRGCVYAKVYFADGSTHTRPATTGCYRST